MAPARPSPGLGDLPAEVLELILIAVADPWSLRSLSLTCRRLAAATSASSPLWRALLAAHVDLTPLRGCPTEWETELYCYWNESDGGDSMDGGDAGEMAGEDGNGMDGEDPDGMEEGDPDEAAEEDADEAAGEDPDDAAEEDPDDMEGEDPDGAAEEDPDEPAGEDANEPAGEDPDHAAGEDPAEAAFVPPLSRVRGWTEGVLPAVPSAVVERSLARHESAKMVPGEADEYGDLTRDGGPPAWETGFEWSSSDEDEAAQAGGNAAARPPVGSFLYVDNRPGGAGPAAAAAGATASPPAAPGVPRGAPTDAEDPRTLYTGLATLARAAAAVHTAHAFDVECGWGSEAPNTQWHLFALRTAPGAVAWPAAGAADAAAAAAADALLAAAGAVAPARQRIVPRSGGVRVDGVEAEGGAAVAAAAAAAAAAGWSGRPAGPLFHTYVAGPAVRHLMGLRRHRNHMMRSEWSAAMRPSHGAAYAAVEAVLGGRPALAFQFGVDAMNPTGGVMAVQWSPTLVLGFLLPIVCT